MHDVRTVRNIYQANPKPGCVKHIYVHMYFTYLGLRTYILCKVTPPVVAEITVQSCVEEII